MFGSDSSRHGRRGRALSVESLAAEVAELRSRNYVDQLEVVRLGALVTGLTGHIERLANDLQEARAQVQVLRMLPTTVDPRIEEMAQEILHLRDVIAAQQSSIIEMTSRVGDLLVQVAASAPREVPVASVAPAPVAAEVPVTVMAAARSVAEVDAGAATAFVEPALAADGYAFAVAPVAGPVDESAAEFDDATLRRLRLIRQAFEN